MKQASRSNRKKARGGPKKNRRGDRRLRPEFSDRDLRSAGRLNRLKAFVAAEERERQRISRELHDNIGQQVTALLLGLKRLDEPRPKQAATRATLRLLREIAERLGRDIHQVAMDLLPASLGDLGVVRCLANLVETRMARERVVIDLDSEEFGAAPLPEELAIALYRIIHAALDHAIREARASQVAIFLRHRAGEILAIVEDNGTGLDRRAEDHMPPSGLIGLTERVYLANGATKIESVSGKGTTVIVRLPVPSATPSPDA